MRNYLRRYLNISISYNRLRLLMQGNNLQSSVRRKRRKNCLVRAKEAAVDPNLLNREFSAAAPNMKYVTDITYVPIRGAMAYLSVIMDLYNREIVAHKISTLGDASLSVDVVKALRKKRNLHGALLHSDQGVHYTNKAYTETLRKNGIVASMSRKGNCWDNAIIENFFGNYKNEWLKPRRKSIHSLEDVIDVTETYLEYYNKYRLQKRLGNYPPVQYRLENFKN